MVIIFQSKKARAHLLQKCVVFTFRAHRRKKLGKDWMTDRRGGFKITDVSIEEEGCFNPLDLGPYVDFSGFTTLEEWLKEIRRLNKGKLPRKGWLYRVSLR